MPYRLFFLIRSFRCKESGALYEGRYVPRFKGSLKQAERRMDRLDQAVELKDLTAFRGDRKGQHSIHINDQCRICFIWCEDGPHEVEIVDYH